MSKPHLADVAREAGVSVGAASLALSGRGRIAEATRQRVREAAERLGYHADPVARAMRGGRLPLIGLVLTDLRDPAEFELWAAFWSQALTSLSLAAVTRHYGFVLLPRLAGTDLSAVPLAGYAVIGTDVSDDDVQAALATGLPVLTDSAVDDPAISVRIAVDYDRTLIDTLEHLRAAGARLPGVLGVGNDTGWGRSVVEGHRQWVRSTGIDAPIVDMQPDAFEGEHPGERAVEHLLEQGVDAIVTVFTDPRAILSAAERHGRTIGRDLLVVAIDEDFQGDFARHDITTVSIDLPDIIGRSVDRFIAVIEGAATAPAVVPTTATLHRRGSSGPLG